MITNIGAVLQANGIGVEDTPYTTNICDYNFDAGNFCATREIDTYKSSFSKFRDYDRELATKTKRYQEKLDQLTKEINQTKTLSTTEYVGETLRDLRIKKKELQNELNGYIRKYYGTKQEKYVVTYRDMLVANTMQNIAEIVEPFKAAKHGRILEMPIFTRGIDKLDDIALKNAGVLGGPCLFGVDEMILEITHSGGEKHLYDFVSNQHCIDPNAMGLSEHFRHFAGKITNVSFDNRKTKLTKQEYETMAYPMEIANILDVPLVFPMPDISYKKYLESASSDINDAVRNRMLDDFTQETNRIADLHIALFHRLLKSYPLRRYTILHGREPSLINHFYEKREKYFRSEKRRRKFTSLPDKVESIYDYISFIATPFYFWNTTNILQVDVIREADSMKKCADAHGSEIEIFGFLFSGLLSKSGTATNYEAKQHDKMYLEELP